MPRPACSVTLSWVEPIAIDELPGGELRGYSEALGLYFCWREARLDWYDPRAEDYIPSQESERRLREQERLRADTERQRADTELQLREQERQRAEARIR